MEILTTDALDEALARDLKSWLIAAFDGEFEAEDWQHALGGTHVWMRDAHGIVSHAAVVRRRFECGGHALSVGYVEAVATRSDQRHRGHATRVMQEIGGLIQRDHDVGALSTGLHRVYEPLGWQRWQGATYALTPRGRLRTAEDDDSVMVLLTPRTPPLDHRHDITADWRTGDVW